MATTIPYSEAGMASFQTETFTDVELFAGEVPPRWTSNETVATATVASADLPAFTVVGKDGSGNIVPAVLGTVVPIGITTATVKTGSTNKTVAIFRAGSFNTDALNWDASFATDAQRKSAFEAGYAGAAFSIKKPHYSGVYF